MTNRTSPPGRRVTDERLHGVLQGIQTLSGIDVSNAQLIKFTNNAVFQLPHAGVVARIAGSATMANRVEKVIRVARWLEAAEVPAVRLLGIPQPLTVDNMTVTLWHEVRGGGRTPTGADLAVILQQWHRLPPPDGGLPPWNPIAEIRSRLQEPDGIADTDLTYFHSECDRLEEQLGMLTYELPAGPIHGDAFMGNLIAGVEGPVIADFDSSCDGAPREWELTPMAVGKLRFDYPGDDYGALTARYGFDVTAWSGFPVLRRLRELKLVTSVVPVLGSRPALVPQWQRRLHTYRTGDQTARWTTYTGAS